MFPINCLFLQYRFRQNFLTEITLFFQLSTHKLIKNRWMPSVSWLHRHLLFYAPSISKMNNPFGGLMWRYLYSLSFYIYPSHFSLTIRPSLIHTIIVFSFSSSLFTIFLQKWKGMTCAAKILLLSVKYDLQIINDERILILFNFSWKIITFQIKNRWKYLNK